MSAPTATFTHTLRSEWTKLASLTSFWWTLVATAALGVGISALTSSDEAGDGAAWDPTHASLFTGVIFATLAMVVLGVLVIASEHGTGMIRASVVAVPRRGRLLAAKATVLTLVALPVGVVVGFGMFFAGQAVLAGADVPHATLDQPHVLRAVLGTGCYLAAAAVLSLAVATLVRSTAGSIALMFAAMLLIPTAILPSLPAAIGDPLLKFWPSAAGSSILATRPDPAALGPWPGLGWMWLVTMVVLAVAFTVFGRRDV